MLYQHHQPKENVSTCLSLSLSRCFGGGGGCARAMKKTEGIGCKKKMGVSRLFSPPSLHAPPPTRAQGMMCSSWPRRRRREGEMRGGTNAATGLFFCSSSPPLGPFCFSTDTAREREREREREERETLFGFQWSGGVDITPVVWIFFWVFGFFEDREQTGRRRHREGAVHAEVNLVTALVPSDTACLASSPGRIRRTAVWISREVTVGFLL